MTYAFKKICNSCGGALFFIYMPSYILENEIALLKCRQCGKSVKLQLENCIKQSTNKTDMFLIESKEQEKEIW